MMETVQEVMGDKEGESKQETDQSNLQQVVKNQDVPKSERELKDDVFNQMTNLKSMKGHYILITRRQV